MLARCLAAALLLAAPARLARGEPAAPGPGRPAALVIGYLGPQVTIDHLLLELRAAQPRTAHLVLRLIATHTARRELAAVIQLPAGARATRFAYTGGGGERQIAQAAPARRATESYAAVRASGSAALLEAAGADRLALRVPIGAELRAEVELELALSPAPSLAIDPAGQTIHRAEIRLPGGPRLIRDDLAAPLDIALAPRPSGDPARPPAAAGGVTADTSLLIGAVPTVEIGAPVSACLCGGDPRQVRRVIRQHHAQLRYCYERVAQWNPQLAGTAVLHFVIGRGGRVRASSVDGDLGHAGVERCLADEVLGWDFGEGVARDAEIQVNYPLRFQMAP